MWRDEMMGPHHRVEHAPGCEPEMVEMVGALPFAILRLTLRSDDVPGLRT